MKNILLLLLISCSTFAQNAAEVQAKKIADNVVKAMGGRKAYDNTRHITWNFFGSRKLTWDKWTGNVRIDFLKENSIFLVNVQTKTGKILKNGIEITQVDSVAKYVKQANSIWINDSYWLLMPFKLHDAGVNLLYLGKEKTQQGEEADVLQLSFQGVGLTPENQYKIYVNPATNLVNQWAFFRKGSQEKPDFVMPWTDYKQYGKILLSGNRGERRLSDIQVYDEVPTRVYEFFDKPDFRQSQQKSIKKQGRIL